MINKRKSGSKSSRRAHVIGQDAPFAVVEAYKSARTGLVFTNLSDGCNVVAFTSSEPGDGKTVTCINMAITLAESGKRVLLIDSDMRKPQVAATMNLAGMPGLSELLSGMIDMVMYPDLCRQRTMYRGLDVIAAGSLPPNPAELISCPRTEALFARLKQEYDYILIDTPPSLVMTDALLYKNIADGYVVVIRANKTRIDETERLVEKFKQVNARIIGFILNDRIHSRKQYKKYGDYDHE